MKKKRGKEKQININIKISNRWFYTFIVVGILLIIGVGVYAVDTSQAWHSSDQIDFSDGIKIPQGGVCIDSDGACSVPPDGGLRIGEYGIDAADSAGNKIMFRDDIEVEGMIQGEELCIGTDCVDDLSGGLYGYCRTCPSSSTKEPAYCNSNDVCMCRTGYTKVGFSSTGSSPYACLKD